MGICTGHFQLLLLVLNFMDQWVPIELNVLTALADRESLYKGDGCRFWIASANSLDMQSPPSCHRPFGIEVLFLL